MSLIFKKNANNEQSFENINWKADIDSKSQEVHHVLYKNPETNEVTPVWHKGNHNLSYNHIEGTSKLAIFVTTIENSGKQNRCIYSSPSDFYSSADNAKYADYVYDENRELIIDEIVTCVADRQLYYTDPIIKINGVIKNTITVEDSSVEIICESTPFEASAITTNIQNGTIQFYIDEAHTKSIANNPIKYGQTIYYIMTANTGFSVDDFSASDNTKLSGDSQDIGSCIFNENNFDLVENNSKTGFSSVTFKKYSEYKCFANKYTVTFEMTGGVNLNYKVRSADKYGSIDNVSYGNYVTKERSDTDYETGFSASYTEYFGSKITYYGSSVGAEKAGYSYDGTYTENNAKEIEFGNVSSPIYLNNVANNYKMTITVDSKYIESISYKIGNSSYTTVSKTITVDVPYKSEYSIYATPAGIYNLTGDFSKDTPHTAVMSKSGASYNPSEIISGSLKFVNININANDKAISKIYCKKDEDDIWNELYPSNNKISFCVQLGAPFYFYYVLNDGYECSDYYSAEKCYSGEMTGDNIDITSYYFASFADRNGIRPKLIDVVINLTTGVSEVNCSYYSAKGYSGEVAQTSKKITQSASLQVSYDTEFSFGLIPADGYSVKTESITPSNTSIFNFAWPSLSPVTINLGDTRLGYYGFVVNEYNLAINIPESTTITYTPFGENQISEVINPITSVVYSSYDPVLNKTDTKTIKQTTSFKVAYNSSIELTATPHDYYNLTDSIFSTSSVKDDITFKPTPTKKSSTILFSEPTGYYKIKYRLNHSGNYAEIKNGTSISVNYGDVFEFYDSYEGNPPYDFVSTIIKNGSNTQAYTDVATESKTKQIRIDCDSYAISTSTVGHQYTITFHNRGTKVVVYNETLPTIDDTFKQTKDGNNFNGYWYNGVQLYDSDLVAKSDLFTYAQDITVEAKFTPRPITVKIYVTNSNYISNLMYSINNSDYQTHLSASTDSDGTYYPVDCVFGDTISSYVVIADDTTHYSTYSSSEKSYTILLDDASEVPNEDSNTKKITIDVIRRTVKLYFADSLFQNITYTIEYDGTDYSFTTQTGNISTGTSTKCPLTNDISIPVGANITFSIDTDECHILYSPLAQYKYSLYDAEKLISTFAYEYNSSTEYSDIEYSPTYTHADFSITIPAVNTNSAELYVYSPYETKTCYFDLLLYRDEKLNAFPFKYVYMRYKKIESSTYSSWTYTEGATITFYVPAGACVEYYFVMDTAYNNYFSYTTTSDYSHAYSVPASESSPNIINKFPVKGVQNDITPVLNTIELSIYFPVTIKKIYYMSSYSDSSYYTVSVGDSLSYSINVDYNYSAKLKFETDDGYIFSDGSTEKIVELAANTSIYSLYDDATIKYKSSATIYFSYYRIYENAFYYNITDIEYTLDTTAKYATLYLTTDKKYEISLSKQSSRTSISDSVVLPWKTSTRSYSISIDLKNSNGEIIDTLSISDGISVIWENPYTLEVTAVTSSSVTVKNTTPTTIDNSAPVIYLGTSSSVSQNAYIASSIKTTVYYNNTYTFTGLTANKTYYICSAYGDDFSNLEYSDIYTTKTSSSSSSSGCVDENSLILISLDGESTLASHLSTGDTIISVSGDTFVENRIAGLYISTKNIPMYRVILENDNYLDISGKHPILCTTGYKTVEDTENYEKLSMDDYVICFNNLSYKVKNIYFCGYNLRRVYNFVCENDNFIANNIIVACEDPTEQSVAYNDSYGVGITSGGSMEKLDN